jgi:hypothetical protein
MMANILQDPRQFQVSPSSWGQEALQLGSVVGGLGQAIQQMKQQEEIGQYERDKELLQKQMIEDAYTAYEAGDRDTLVKLAAQMPELSKSLLSGVDFKSDATKENWVAGQQQIAAGFNPVDVLTKRAAFLQDQGADATETLQELEEVKAMTPEQLELYKNRTGALLDATGQWDMGEKVKAPEAPATVRETEWFLKQTPEVQKKHLELKRKTDPTMAEKLEQKQKEADITVDTESRKTTAKSTAERQQGFIDSGVEAADSLGNAYQVRDLLDSVKTGGFDAAALRAKQLFGIESGDEAQLSAGLGKAILSQLKPIFGAAFTAAEGERLERIEANFGKSTEGNKRLIDDVIKITERAANRGIKAAESQGDKFSADEIRSVLDALKKKEPEQDLDRVVLNNAQYGDITEADIQQTMKDNNMTREEVISRLGG